MHSFIDELKQSLPHPSKAVIAQCLERLELGHPIRLAAQASQTVDLLCDGHRDDYATVRHMIQGAYEANDPTDLGMRVWLLSLAIKAAKSTFHIAEASQLAMQLAALPIRTLDRRFQLIPHRDRFAIAFESRQFEQAEQELRAALTLIADDTTSDAWLEFTYHLGQLLVVQHDWQRAEPIIATLTAHADRAHERIGIDVSYIQGQFYAYSGQFDKAREWIEQHAHHQLTYLLQLDIAAGLNDPQLYAQVMDNAPVGSRPSDHTPLGHSIGYLYSLVCDNLAQARMHLREMQRNSKDWDLHGHAIDERILLITLREQRCAESRRLLTRLDPTESDPTRHVEWARLLVAEGQWEAAVQHIARGRSRGFPGALVRKFSFARELNSRQVAHLWAASETAPAKTTQAASTRSPTADAQATLVGNSTQMRALRQRVELYSARNEPVLIIGEKGSGKELVARLLHEQRTDNNGPFIAINCAALPQSLAEAELFGAVDGNSTGGTPQIGALDRAAGGTLFLDEIAAMPEPLQRLLLQVFETGALRSAGSSETRPLQANIIVANDHLLEEAIEQRGFCPELFYQLDRLSITIPPLRHRLEDLNDLSQYFIEHLGSEQAPVLSNGLMSLWQQHAWPGNVREFRNEIERLMAMYGDASELLPEYSRLWRDSPVAKAQPAKAAQRSPKRNGKRMNARQRQAALQSLVAQNGRISRKELIAATGCAPNTARTDLETLVAAGLLKRVDTSGNLKTSYYVPEIGFSEQAL